VTLKLKASRERNSSLLLIFCGQEDFAQMPFTLRYVQYMVTSVLQDHQYIFSVRSLLVDEKALLMKQEIRSTERVSAQCDAFRMPKQFVVY